MWRLAGRAVHLVVGTGEQPDLVLTGAEAVPLPDRGVLAPRIAQVPEPPVSDRISVDLADHVRLDRSTKTTHHDVAKRDVTPDTPADAAGHIKSVLVGANLTLIVSRSRLLLGSSQRV